MICLNKADERTLRYLSWNQSPPALASQHTTCQDLNGMANLREHVAAGQDDGDGGGGGIGLLHGDETGGRPHHENDRVNSELGFGDAGRWYRELSSRLKAIPGGDGQDFFTRVSSPTVSSRLAGWIIWCVSVIICSFLISSFTKAKSTIQLPLNAPLHGGVKDLVAAGPLISDALISHLPLSQKRSTCSAGGISDKDKYDIPLHAGALLIVWFVSTLASAFPILAVRFPGLRIPGRFFFAVRHFGTGVLIATAFVHLLPTAFISLGDPCLGGFWINDYPAMPGAISLAAIFFVTVIEMVFHPSRRAAPVELVSTSSPRAPSVDECAVAEPERTASHQAADGVMLPMRNMGPLRGRSTSIGHGLSQLSNSDLEQLRIFRQDVQSAPARAKTGPEDISSAVSQQDSVNPEQKQRKERLQVVLLEMGILFHSVFIGMALSVSIGSEFIVLLIAIVFHQTFEGLALGSRIASIDWTNKTKQPWLMAFAYGCTTPLGQAIGLATHSLYSPSSEIGLIVVGVMNAISAGLLTFASLVELLSEDFLSDESWLYLRGRQRVFACLLVFFGAFFMSLVGAWA